MGKKERKTHTHGLSSSIVCIGNHTLISRHIYITYIKYINLVSSNRIENRV